MDEALLAEYRASTYLVCIDTIRWSKIALGQPLPAHLQGVVGERTWAFITAWNPRSVRRPDPANEAAQQDLLERLGHEAATSTILPAIGIGPDGWHEPSLFAIGPGFDVFDRLGVACRQNAYVRGHGTSEAELHVLCP